MLSVLKPGVTNVAVTALMFISFVFPIYASDSSPCIVTAVVEGVEVEVASADPNATVSADCSAYSSVVMAAGYVNGDMLLGFVEDQNLRLVVMFTYWYVLGSAIGYAVSAVRKGGGKK